MKKIRITLEGTGRTDVHDGLGGVHKHGHIIEVPDDVANAFVAAKLAVIADGSSTITAIAEHKEAVSTQQMQAEKARAEAAMRTFDRLPPEVREVAREDGDAVIEDHIASDGSAGPMVEYDMDTMEPKRKRGRPRKEAI